MVSSLPLQISLRPSLSFSLSLELLICVAVMLKCSVRHYKRQISCFSCRRTHDERLVDLCPSWWRRRASASRTPYSGRGSGGGGLWGGLGVVGMELLLKSRWMDTFYGCTDVEQMLDSGMASLLVCYLQQTHGITGGIYAQQSFGFQIEIQTFDGLRLRWLSTMLVHWSNYKLGCQTWWLACLYSIKILITTEMVRKWSL